ncbi:MAG: hypothetical protein OXU20_09980 [Myxococcales bacterium]|nr:hypothetical protein [Myxococcales bacterium]
MYIHMTRTSRDKDRKRTSRYRAKLKAKNRRRVNRMAGKRLSAKR